MMSYFYQSTLASFSTLRDIQMDFVTYYIEYIQLDATVFEEKG